MPITCARTFAEGEILVFATESGIYVTNEINPQTYGEPILFSTLRFVSHLEILEEQHLLVVLADKALFILSLQALVEPDLDSKIKRGKRMCHCDSFAMRRVGEEDWICAVKTNSTQAVVKLFRVLDCAEGLKMEEEGWKSVLSGAQDVFRFEREVWLDLSVRAISFLDERLCLSTSAGPQIMDLETLEMEALLDPSGADPLAETDRRRRETYLR